MLSNSLQKPNLNLSQEFQFVYSVLKVIQNKDLLMGLKRKLDCNIFAQKTVEILLSSVFDLINNANTANLGMHKQEMQLIQYLLQF